MAHAAALAGSTGLVGSHILTALLNIPSVSTVSAYTRRELPASSPKLFPLNNADTSLWPKLFPRTPAPHLLISALGTTRAQAGGFEAQRKIDLDLNYELAKAAKDAGVETYVLISSGGANSASSMPYIKMKGELEDRVKELNFKYTVIVKPGLIVGTRQDTRLVEAVLRTVATGLGKIHSGLKDSWAQDADVIAKAAVAVGLQCVEGKREAGVWEVGSSEILKLGKGQ